MQLQMKEDVIQTVEGAINLVKQLGRISQEEFNEICRRIRGMETPPVKEPERAYTRRQVAEALNISLRTLDRMIGRGEIQTKRVSERRRVIMSSDLEKYLAQIR